MQRVLNASETRIFKKGTARRLFAFKTKGKTIFYRCGTCGAISQKTHKRVSDWGINHLASWHSKEKGGASGPCKPCGKDVIRKRYPEATGFRFTPI